LWGWEPREFAEYHYDDDGRVTGVTTHREAEFNTAQVNLLLAHRRAMADFGPHGQPMSEATDPAANPAADGGWHYEATRNGVMDYAQLAINEARDAYFKQYGDKLTDAQKAAKQWRVQKVLDD
jgi:hypothetical protein